MRAKLQATRERIRSGEGHVHGKDYGDSAELQADFDMLRDALRRHGGEEGRRRRPRHRPAGAAAASGLNLATLDVREHSEKHHEVLARLFDRVGELDRPYSELSRAERTTVLGRELGSRRPLVGSAITEDESILDERHPHHLQRVPGDPGRAPSLRDLRHRDLHHLDDPRRR